MTQPDLDNITATDLSDDERLSTLYLVGWIFSPPRKFLESCRGLVE